MLLCLKKDFSDQPTLPENLESGNANPNYYSPWPNKLLRNIRINKSKKIDQISYLTDCLNRLWVDSDPILNKVRNEASCSCTICKTYGHFTHYCSKIQIHGCLTQYEDLYKSFLDDC